MSVQVALQFIQQVRKDESLKSKLQVLGCNNVDIEILIKIGSEAGFTFTSEDLQNAHKQDWVMRSIRYGFMMSKNEFELLTKLPGRRLYDVKERV